MKEFPTVTTVGEEGKYFSSCVLYFDHGINLSLCCIYYDFENPGFVVLHSTHPFLAKLCSAVLGLHFPGQYGLFPS